MSNAPEIVDLLDALTVFEQPAAGDLAASPILDCWSWVGADGRALKVVGTVVKSDKFAGGVVIGTSAVAEVDCERRWVRTQNTLYRLGWPGGAAWPPALQVAACADWGAALDAARVHTGEHTLDPVTLISAGKAGHRESGKPLDWTAWRIACNQVALALKDASRYAVAEAWWLLGADMSTTRDRLFSEAWLGDYKIKANGRDLTPEERSAIEGWEILAGSTDDSVHDFGDLSDPFKLAHALAAEGGKARPAGKFSSGAEAALLKDAIAGSASTNGVVVMGKVGAVETTHGREAARMFAAIAGNRIPVTPVPDLVVARRALVAEFPYAVDAIDVLLSDLVGAASVRMRPTLLVGPPGGGKSRLARRIGEVVGLHVARYDAASASDSSFGGTARRWSSGEPAVPVAALLAAMRADAMVLLDELDKAGTGNQNGRLQDALLPFMEFETAARYPDVYAQTQVDCSRISYLATANDELRLPGPLRDRFRLLRIPAPTIEHLPSLCRSILADLVKESASDPHWFPALDADEIWMAGELWKAGSLRRLRDIVGRIVIRRSNAPRH
jgi:hypothetical protein